MSHVQFKTKIKVILWFLSNTLSLCAVAKDLNQYQGSFCPFKEQILTISNTDSIPADIWIHTNFENEIVENHFQIAANSIQKFSGQEINNQNYAYFIKSHSEKIKSSLECKERKTQGATTPSSLQKIISNKASLFYITNLFYKTQTVEIQFFSHSNILLKKTTLTLYPYLTTTTYKEVPPENTHYIYFKGEGRFIVNYQNLPNNTILPATPEIDQLSLNTLNGVYFLISDLENSESFIIQVSDLNMIHKIRSLIKNNSRKMLIGKIQKDHGNFNRNMSSKEKAIWSWHVNEIVNFNDFASIDCSAYPSLIEERIDYFTSQNEGLICFWGFFPMKELTESEVRYGEFKKAPNL